MKGDIVIDLKSKKEKNYKPLIVFATICLFIIISVISLLSSSFDGNREFIEIFVDSNNEEDVRIEEILELSKDMDNFFEIAKNQNLALNISEDSEFAYPGIPNELNEYPMYRTCDGRVMPNNVNPFASYSWVILAHASMYDATGEEKYAEVIKKTENKLYKLYNEVYIGETTVMFHPLYKTYLLLKGKSILNDGKFIGMILEDTQKFVEGGSLILQDEKNYLIVQDVAMRAASFADSSKLFSEKSGNEIQSRNMLKIAEKFNEYAINIANSPNRKQDGVKCWLVYSQYYLDSAKGKKTNSFEELLLSDKFKEDILSTELPTANSFQPCMEVMLDLYEESGNKLLLDKFEEYNNVYFLETSNNENSCGQNTKFALRNNYYDEEGGLFFLSDNAYQTYLITRPEVKWSLLS